MMPRWFATGLHCVPVVGDSDREAWLAERKNGIGASEVWKVESDPASIYAQKLGLIEPIDLDDVERVQVGREIEPWIAKQYSERASAHIECCGTMLRSVAWPWLFATPDYLQLTESGLVVDVQIKNTEFPSPYAEGLVPHRVDLQVQTEMAVTGLTHAVVVAFVRGNRLIWIDVERDEKKIAAIVAVTKALWQCIQDEEPPALGAASNAVATAIYPPAAVRVEREPELLPGDLIEPDERRLHLKALVAAMEGEVLGIENRFKDRLSENPFGMLPNGVQVSWKPDKTGVRKFYRKEPR